MGASDGGDGLRIVVEGCGHGELEKIYRTVGEMEQAQGFKVDLLICCGDFQAVRNCDDLETMSVPPKYRQLATFYKYYSGELVAPVLTLFIGGNHEAANYLWELYHGGWVAPNIYFLGYAGVVNFGGLRIGGLSGIYNEHHYRQGHHEAPPYTPKTIKSAYHIRELEVFRLLQLKQPLDIFLSHDWPRGVYNFGNKAELLRKKPFFRSEVERNDLGSPAAEQLMAALQPTYWFSAHLHVKHAALVIHPPAPGQQVGKSTKFLALDKCLPGRDFLQMVHIPLDRVSSEPLCLTYDPEWLAILRTTHSLLSTSYRASPLPHNPPGPSQQQIDFVKKILSQKGSDVPENFCQTAPAIPPGSQVRHGRMPTRAYQNPQTKQFLDMLLLDYNLGGYDSLTPGTGDNTATGLTPPNPEEIELGEEIEDDDAVPDGGEEDGAVDAGNPEEIDLGDEGAEEQEEAGEGGLFGPVEIHGSSIVDRNDL